MAIFLTADTHFGHSNILRYTDRHLHWTSIEDMNKALVDNWNRVVSASDEVFIVGDFAWANHARYINILKGKKYLIKGSHDKMQESVLNQFSGVATEMVVPLTETRKALLHHTALRVWEKSHYGMVVCCFGHSHGRLTTFNMSRDVGVDCADAAYAPLRASYLAGWFDARELTMKAEGRIVTEASGRVLYRQDDVAYLMNKLNPGSENAEGRSQGYTQQEILRRPEQAP